MKKILQVTNLYPIKSIPVFGSFVKEQLSDLKAKGIDFDLYFINAREKGRFEYFRSFNRLKRIVNNYDIIHCHHLLSAFVVLKINPNAKVIVSFLSDGYNELILSDNFFNNKLSKYIYNYVVDHSDVRIFKKSIPNNLIDDKFSFYIPNGVNQKIFYNEPKELAKEKLKLSNNKKYVLFVSSQSLFRPEKRYDLYTDVIKILKIRDPDIEELAITDVPRDIIRHYYNASELHLLTSDFEGSPNSIKESLSCNTPVVSLDVGNVVEMLEGLNNCYVVNNRDPYVLAEYCHSVINQNMDFSLNNKIIELGLTNDNITDKIIEIYNLIQ